MEKVNPEQEPDLSKYDWVRAFDEMQDLVSLIDTDYRIIKANKAFIRKFGSGKEELEGDHCADLITRKSGEIFDIATIPLFDKSGNLACSIQIARDITLRKRKEQLMEVNLALGEYALTHSLEEILVMTVDKAEMLTNSKIGFFHFMDEREDNVSLKAFSTNTLGKECSAEKHLSHYPVAEAGVWVDCYYQKQPVIHQDYNALPHRKGLPEGHVPVVRELTIPVVRDDKVVAILGVGNKPIDYNQDDADILTQITNLAYEYVLRKRFELALHDSEKYARALLDAIPDLIFRMDKQGVYLDYKSAKEDLYFQASSIIGRNNRDLTQPEFADLLQEKIRLTLESNSMVVFEYNMDIPGKGLRDYEARMVPSGQDEITAISRDITERKKADNALKKKIEELEWINHMMIDREMKMIDLKTEVNELLIKSGQHEKYTIHSRTDK